MSREECQREMSWGRAAAPAAKSTDSIGYLFRGSFTLAGAVRSLVSELLFVFVFLFPFFVVRAYASMMQR